MNEKIDNLVSESLDTAQSLQNIKNIIDFARNILNAENIIIWFKDKNDDDFISFWNENKRTLSKKYIESFLKPEIKTIYIDEESDNIFLQKVQHFSNYSKDIKSVIFHREHEKSSNRSLLMEVVNLKDRSLVDEKTFKDTLKLISTILIQTINMNGVSSLTNYYFEEQTKAYKKQKAVLQNDLEKSKDFYVDLFYKPSDILNGDSYSIYKASNGDILVYVLDAMGHGIGPSLTAYSISTIVQQHIKSSSNLNSIVEKVLNHSQFVLTDEEQLTCGFFWFSKNLSQVEYVVAGMYSPIILDGKNILHAKANNIPFMNFATDFKITTIDLQDFKSFLIFTDGLIEDTQDLEINIETMLKDREYCTNIYKLLNEIYLEDDTTIIRMVKK